MKYARGARKLLRNTELDPDYVTNVLERLEGAVPHLHFAPWKVKIRAQPEDAPIGEVIWANQGRTHVHVGLDVKSNVRLESTSFRDHGAIPNSDYEFLFRLADEAARLLTASMDTALSLFDFGMVAVADEVQRRANLGIGPLPILQFIRSLSQETYENQRLSYGLIFTDARPGLDPFERAFNNKRIKRLTDGFSTALLVDAHGNISGYASFAAPIDEGLHMTRRPWWVAGLANESHSHNGVGVALLRSGDMIIVHRGRMLFNQRGGKWRIWNHAAILARLRHSWQGAGNTRHLAPVLTALYHVALDLSFRRSGGLLVVVNSRARINELLMSTSDRVHANSRGVAEQALDDLVTSKKVQRIDRRIITDLASLDGAFIVDRTGEVLAYGAMTKSSGGAKQGARTRAAIASSRHGVAIKVSSDGNVTFLSDGKVVMDL